MKTRIKYERRYAVKEESMVLLLDHPDVYEFIDDELAKLGFVNADGQDIDERRGKSLMSIEYGDGGSRGSLVQLLQLPDGRLYYNDMDGGTVVVSTKPVTAQQVKVVLAKAVRLGKRLEDEE